MRDVHIPNEAGGRNLPARIVHIIREVAVEFDLAPGDIVGDCTRRHITRARHEAMQRARRLEYIDGSRPSFSQIGRWFNRDHTTVMHACRGMEPAQGDLFSVGKRSNGVDTTFGGSNLSP